jgi:hypothetical protein
VVVILPNLCLLALSCEADKKTQNKTRNNNRDNDDDDDYYYYDYSASSSNGNNQPTCKTSLTQLGKGKKEENKTWKLGEEEALENG